MAKPGKPEQRDLFSLAEEGTHLLRRAPVRLWLTYFVGTLPFIAGLFYFWSDMSRSGLAESRVLESSLLLALLYLFMKIMQAWFCDGLMGMVQGRGEERAPPLPLRGWLRLIASQMWIHATAPWVLLVSMISLLPMTWTYAFYHNVTVLSVDHFRKGGRTRPLVLQSIVQTKWQFAQQIYLLGLLTVAAMLVYANLVVALALAAMLSKSFTGTENVFSMSPMLLFSSPVQALIISLCYLVMNPLVKSIYVLRCFYGAARQSGADLQVRLRAVRHARTTPVVALAFLLSCGSAVQGAAPPSTAAAVESPGSVPTEQLDQSIHDVLKGSEFQWRMPREGGKAAQDDSVLGSTMRAFTDWLNASIEDLGKLLGDAMDWLFGNKKSNNPGSDYSPGGERGSSTWAGFMPTLLKILAVVLVIALAWMFFRYWKQTRRTVVVQSTAAPEIDLEHEHLIASQLPENEWLRLAREKLEAGDLRLALRALFLATLAHLGDRRLLHISRTKSNGDYLHELGWRARNNTALQESFSQQVRVFDRVWYGWHEVSRDLMTRFQEQHERITSHAA